MLPMTKSKNACECVFPHTSYRRTMYLEYRICSGCSNYGPNKLVISGKIRDVCVKHTGK